MFANIEPLEFFGIKLCLASANILNIVLKTIEEGGLKLSRKPKILFFMPSLVAGGAEIHTLRLAERLQAEEFPIKILVHGTNASEPLALWPVARNACRLKLRGMSDWMGWVKVWRALRESQPDIIVCVNQTPFLVSEVARRTFATRAKLVCIFHTTVMQPFESHLERPFKLLARYLDLLIYVGEGQRRNWSERGLRARRERVIQNGIDLDKFTFDGDARAATRAKLGFSQETFILATVGKFRSEKRYEDVVRALAIARDKGSQAGLILVGDGPTRAATRDLAHALGLDASLRFVGEQNDVRPYLNASDIGVITSSIESFPLIALEFLAAGRPMLISEVVGALEIAPVQNRLTHIVGDIERLAENILAAEQPEIYRKLSNGAREGVERFTEKGMVFAYAEELRKLFDDDR